MSAQKTIVWFQNDLRIQDNPALKAAVEIGSIIPIYILDEKHTNYWNNAQAHHWWLHHSLYDLSESLSGSLQVYRGDPLVILPKLIKKNNVQNLFWNQCWEPWALDRDKKIITMLKDISITIEIFNGSLLWEPGTIVKPDKTHYKVFKAFLNTCYKDAPEPRQIVKISKKISCSSSDVTNINDLTLLPSQELTKNLEHYWVPTEAEAHKKLKNFIKKNIDTYPVDRDIPAINGTSHLSPYLHFGQISPHQIWWSIQEHQEAIPKKSKDCFLRELVWREFAYHVLYFNPNMTSKNLNSKFDHLGWQYHKKDVTAWQHGKTGYPLIDAGMRELYQTGYMHNRVRMIVASFLVKNLLINWKMGADWFVERLVDADMANNSFNWQWVAGTGYDAAPFFRIFNPVLQAKKFDPDGQYIKKWVPELKNLPTKYLYNPSQAPDNILKKAGVFLDDTYPKAIIDLASSRTTALKLFKKL